MTSLPRLFWPAILALAGLVAAVLMLSPMAAMFGHGSTCYNEGWNAFYIRDTIQGKPLYGAPPGLTGNNYPPLSFHLLGLLSRVLSPTGADLNLIGRWVALVSLAGVAVLCGAIVRRLTASTPLAAYTAFVVVVWMAVFKSDRIAMNDPQLLGTVFSLLGLYVYIRFPDRPVWLVISAAVFTASVFTKHNLLAFPAAVGLHLLWERKWRNLAIWGAAGVAGTVAMLLWTRAVDGPFFLANLLLPRTRTAWLIHLTDYAVFFPTAIVLAFVWALHQRKNSPRFVLALAFFTTNFIAAAFAGGYGVDRNIFFDPMFTLAMIGSLVFFEFAPGLSAALAGGMWTALPLAALLLAPSLGILLELPFRLRLESLEFHSVARRSADLDFTVNLLRQRSGPALCEDMLVCFEAGKPLLYDPFSVNNRIKLGRLNQDSVVKLIEDRNFETVQLTGSDLSPEERDHFSAKFMESLIRCYRVEARLSSLLVLVPKR